MKDRLDLTGARWGLQGAEAVLKLRAIRCNGDWDTYWTYHLAQERRRVHESATPTTSSRERHELAPKEPHPSDLKRDPAVAPGQLRVGDIARSTLLLTDRPRPPACPAIPTI